MEKLVVKLDFRRSSRSNTSQTQKQVSHDSNKKNAKDPTGAKRQKTYRNKWKNNELMKQKNIAKCARYRQEVKERRENNARLDKQLRKTERERKAKYRKKIKKLQEQTNNKEKSNDSLEKLKHAKKTIRTLQKAKKRSLKKSKQCTTSSTETPPVTPAFFRKRAQRVREQLPQSPSKWANTVYRVLKNATPKKKNALAFMQDQNTPQRNRNTAQRNTKTPQRNQKKRQFWKSKISQFLQRDDMSRQMPNKKDVVKVNGQPVPKRHLLSSQKEAYLKFLEHHPSYPFKYTTFRKSIPRHIKKINLKDRRVCVCLKCFNMSEKIRALNFHAISNKLNPMSIRSTYKDSVCHHETEFPSIECVDGSCQNCADKLLSKYRDLIEKKGDTNVKYTSWELKNEKYVNSKNEAKEKKVWQQVEHNSSLRDLFKDVTSGMKEFKGHIFRNDYQYFQHQNIAKHLPQSHAIVYADFSQNYALCPNDEIQAVHYVKKQVTIHTMHLIRHSKNSSDENPQLTKEAVVMISDDLKHSSASVYNFTLKLLGYMRDNPEKVGLPTVLHRITDNSGFEYKNKDAFSHLSHYDNLMGVKVIYHFSEPGHGKGPTMA